MAESITEYEVGKRYTELALQAGAGEERDKRPQRHDPKLISPTRLMHKKKRS